MNTPDLPQHRYLGGTEMEYPAMFIHTVKRISDSHVSSDRREFALGDLDIAAALERVSRYMVDPDDPYAFAGLIGSMASNGARVYNDVGSKVEYATPEAISYRDTVHAGIAGEQIVVSALRDVAQRVQGRKLMARGCTSDKHGKSWGRHGSYLLDRRAYPPIEGSSETAHKKRLLCRAGLAHLATRQLFTGGGALLYDVGRDAFHYERSQKVPSLSNVISSGTTGTHKALYNTRDEPHADDTKYFRWHVTPGDYHLSPWADWIELGTTDLLGYLVLLQSITNKGRLERIVLKDGQELRIARAISRDEHHLFELANGKKALAVDIQEMICEDLEELKDNQPELLTEEDNELIGEFRFAVDSQRNNPEALTLCVDWRKRLEILNAYTEKHPGADFETLHKVEQFWDNLDGGKGVQLRELTRMPGYDVAAIARFRHTPPTGTRAEQRSKHIKSHDGSTGPNDKANNEWKTVTITDQFTGVQSKHKFINPFDTDSTLPSEALKVAS